MSRRSPVLLWLQLLLGGLGVLLGLVAIAAVWALQGGIAERATVVLRGAGDGVRAVDGRLGLLQADLARAGLQVRELAREVRTSAPGALSELRVRVRLELLPDLQDARDQLRAIGDVVRAVAGLLEVEDPLLRRPPSHVERHERLEGTMGEVVTARGSLEAQLDEREDDAAAAAGLADAVEGLAQPIEDVRQLAADWREDLAGAGADLTDLAASVTSGLGVVAVVATVLLLWGILGQLCLVRSAGRGLRSPA